MAEKKSMPPELLAHFKKKTDGKDDGEERTEGSDKKGDKSRRKEAVNKARIRMEEKNKEARNGKEKEARKNGSR
jgi:hypothetical protein